MDSPVQNAAQAEALPPPVTTVCATPVRGRTDAAAMAHVLLVLAACLLAWRVLRRCIGSPRGS